MNAGEKLTERVSIYLTKGEVDWLDSIRNKTFPNRAVLIRSMLRTIREADEDWKAETC